MPGSSWSGKSAMAELLFKKFTEGAEPTEAELKAEYDARIAEAPKEEFHARHILVDDEAKAKDLITQLDKGGELRAAREGQLQGRFCDRRRRPRLVQSQPDGQALLGRRSAARDRQVHGDAGQVGVRLARDQARGKARNDAAALRCGQGPARTAGQPEEVRGAPRRSSSSRPRSNARSETSARAGSTSSTSGSSD